MLPLRFGFPLALGLIPLAAGALALWRRRLAGLCTLGAALFLVLALARPQWASPRHRVSRLYLLDVSGSLFLDAAAALEATRKSIESLRPEDRAGLIAFAESAAVALPPTEVRLVPGPLGLPPEPPRPDATDIAAAIRLAVRQLADKDADRQVALLTDGRETLGDAAAEAAIAADEGVRIFVLPVGPTGVADARVARVRAPSSVRLREPFEVRVELAATAPLEGTLTLTRDGQAIAPPRRVAIEPRARLGLSATDRLEEPGSHTYAAQLTLADRCPENNLAECAVLAEGATQVLYLSAAPDPPLAGLLRRTEGMSTLLLDPRKKPIAPATLASADCLILDSVPASDLPAAAQGAIRDWVRDAGGGLIALGGPASFGPGGYEGTPIEEALPVLCSRPKTLALLVALDRSGSMGEEASGRRKIAFAREAVLRAAKQLHKGETFGLLAFAARPDLLLPVGPVPAEERLVRVLEGIEPHGPTELQLALERSLELLAGAPAQMRLVILVSDGETVRLDTPALRTAFQQADVGLAALMTGKDATATERLRELAGPNFHLVSRPEDLPAKLLDAFRIIMYRPFLLEGTFPVRVAGPAEVTHGVAVAGPLAGYVRTVARPGAVTEWTAGELLDPLLVRWQFGLGRAVAYTSAAGTRWDQRLWKKGAESPFWRQAVQWVARPARTPGFEAEVAERGDAFLATVRAEKDGRFLNGLELLGRVLPPEGEPLNVKFPQTAPGEYQGEFPAARRGIYRLTVTEAGKGIRLSVGVARNYAREWEEFCVDRAAVEAIARNGRGEVLGSLDDLRRVAPRTAVGYADLDWLALAAALILFVTGVFLSVFRARREKM